MPITNTVRDDNGVYPAHAELGAYRTDDALVPIYNPPDSGVMYLAAEPVLKPMNGDQYVFLAQSTTRPGKTTYGIYRFAADFPCDLSADVVEGTPIYWDMDDEDHPEGIAKLEGDVTNGFQIGTATYHYDGNTPPELNEDDEVICGTDASTFIYVRSVEGPHPGKGTYEFGAS